MPNVRVRFAPSPTGYLHVGNARTAFFNWLFARHNEGTFVLRIEDTDVERSEERYEGQLFDDMRWFGLDWDEGPDNGGAFGPYRQSERKQVYAQRATKLIDLGHAYFCFCSADQLEAERQQALKAGLQPKYSGRCRTRPREEAGRKVAAGEPASVRLKISEGAYSWNDLVHGPISFSSDAIGDFILVRSDGGAAYNYAVVIDDHLMEITHVIRGDDHISNTPRQLALYQAFGWEPPAFAHLSTILGPDRTRLSKRHGATSMQNFRELGILPETLRNYVALLGWSSPQANQEILSREELIAQFSLDRITKSPAVFDTEKLNWLNRHYLKECPARALVDLSLPHLAQAGYLANGDLEQDQVRVWLERVLDAVLKNLDHLSQVPAAVKLIFEYDAGRVVSEGSTSDAARDTTAREVLKVFIPKVLAETQVTYERFREIAKAVQRETGKKGKELFHPIRVALTGAVSGPELEKLVPIFEEGARLLLVQPVKGCAQRLREFADAAKLF